MVAHECNEAAELFNENSNVNDVQKLNLSLTPYKKRLLKIPYEIVMSNHVRIPTFKMWQI
jgi:hypothetical protein